MEFQRKERFEARGHTAEAPNSITYYSVVPCDSISIGFLLAYLHGVDNTAIDLENAYLNAPCEQKIWFVGVDVCREYKVCVLIIVRALYGIEYESFLWISD